MRRVVRGGSYNVDNWSLRASFVNWFGPGHRYRIGGFRLVIKRRKQ